MSKENYELYVAEDKEEVKTLMSNRFVKQYALCVNPGTEDELILTESICFNEDKIKERKVRFEKILKDNNLDAKVTIVSRDFEVLAATVLPQ